MGIQADPLLAFLNETGEPNRKYWNLHPNLIRGLRVRGGNLHAKRVQRREGQPATNEHPVVVSMTAEPASEPSKPERAEKADRPRSFFHCLARPFCRNSPSQASSTAAGLSGIYQHRYRSSYTMVFVCGALALISAVVGLAFNAVEDMLAFVELLMLCIILGLVVANQLLRWHERYISYRMLGELLRMSRHLHGLFGWSLPGSRVNNLAHSRRNWVSWFFAATVRATPLATGGFTEIELARTKHGILENLIGGQLRFHRQASERMQRCRPHSGRLGAGLFLMTLMFVLARVVLSVTDTGHVVLPWLGSALRPFASCLRRVLRPSRL